MKRARAAVALAMATLAWATTSARAETAPPCTASAALEPGRAVVGQQVLYRVEIRSRGDVDRVDWIRQPAFPEIRTEIIPAGPKPEALTSDGTRLRVRDDLRALFGERAGRFVLRTQGLRCTLAGGEAFATPVPPVRLELLDPPEEGRAADFAGLVGPLSLHLTVSPERIALGGSVRVAVLMLGDGNLWDAPPPFADSAFGDADVFERRGELRLERGARLFVRRHFAYDVVPRREGTLAVPGLALPYFDPTTGHYAVARSAPTTVSVAPRASPPAAPERASAPLRESGTTASPAHFLWALGAAVAIAAAFVLRHRRRDGGARLALAEARDAHEAGDAEAEAGALSRALRAALAPHVADAAAVAPEELACRSGLPAPVAAAAHVLAGVERARFDPAAPPPDAVAVARAVAELERR